MLKKLILNSLRKAGYQILKVSTLDTDIKAGKFSWLQEMGIRTVLDVGANVGKFTNLISDILTDVNIYSFEPLAECFDELTKNTKHLENVKCFNYALGEEQSEITIYHNEFSPSSSILKMKELHRDIYPSTANSVEEIVQIKDMDSLNDKINWIPKTLMKIDVQGFEINVLKGATSSLNNIDVLIIETLFVELYENQTQFDDIYSFLVKRNFSYRGNHEQIKDPKSGRILWADAVFIKN
jgi:FkbM family methyltransferase